MNSQKELLKRLLDLHSVKTLREFFPDQNATSKDQIIESILSDVPRGTARATCLENISLTKQHVYIFNLKPRLSAGPNWQFIHQAPDLVLGSLDHIYLIRVKYPVFLGRGNQVEKGFVEFDWPVRIYVANKKLYVLITVLERDIRHVDSDIINYGKRDVEEVDIINMINTKLQMNLAPLDLNKGVKHLWDNDIIDSKFVRFKNQYSTSTEAMDEDFTTKVKYPQKFEEIMRTPMNRTIFKVLKDESELGSIFMVEPSAGKLAFSNYPLTSQQVYNVIERIIRFN